MPTARTTTIPTVIPLKCSVGPDDTLVLFGLTYRPDASAATRRVLRRAGGVSVLVDPADLATVLVRDPTHSAFVIASCRTAYARRLSLPAHLARRQSHPSEVRNGRRVEVGPTLPPTEASSEASPQP